MFWTRRSGVQGAVPPGRVRHRNVRRQFQLARSGLDAGKFPADPRTVDLYSFYGDEFKVECPTGSGRYMTLFEVAQEI